MQPVEILATFITTTIAKFGYLGIVLAMALESACIPLPSEIIMPFSGFLVAQGKLNFWLVAASGTLGCLLGSVLAWWVGATFGEETLRYLIRRFGKFVLVFEYELDEAIHRFRRFGEAITFFSRLLPVVRTFISLPAGIARMPFWRFALFTTAGSFPWCAALAYLGFKLGENWNTLGTYFHKFDAVIFFFLLATAIFYLHHKLKRQKEYQRRV